MQPKRRPSVSVLVTAISLVTIAVVVAACTNNAQNPTEPRPQSSGQSPSPSPVGSPAPPADTIIVIRDGSVHMTVYSPCVDDDAGDDKKYKCENIELDKVEIVTDTETITTPTPSPNARIVIDGQGGDKAIEVKGENNPGLKRVTIKFKKKHYPKCDESEKRHVGTNQVGRVSYDRFSKTCDPSEHCVITVKYK